MYGTLTRGAASCAALIGAIFFCTTTHALQAIRAQTPIQLDGKLDEADWQRAPVKADWVENMPNEKAQQRFKNEVRILYDSSAIYFGIKAFDPDISQLKSPFVRRDKVFGSADNLIVWIDPTGARKFAQFFRVNPRGILADGSWNEDNGNEDFSPDFDFEAAAHVGADHWSAEFRIPWTSLRIPHPVPDKLHFIVFRNMPRETRVRMSTAVLGRDPNCFLCVADELTGITDIPKSSGITVTPYITGNFTQERFGASKTNESKFNAGADIKWRPTSEWVIDATLRPDFSQIELDQPQLRSNTRFALFVPEKRPFFLEGNDLYLQPDTSIYTRAITDPLWGARATYRSAALDATVITVADRGGGAIVLPSTYFSDFRAQGKSQATVARIRIPYALAGSGSAGAMLSDRSYANGDSNRLISFDATHKPDDTARARVQLMGSQSIDDDVKRNGTLFYVDAMKDLGPQRFGAYVFGSSPGFRFDSGLVGQNGVRTFGGDYRYCINRKDAFFDNVCPNIAAREVRAWDGELLQRWVTPAVFANGARNSEWNFQPRLVNYRRVQQGGKWHSTPTLYASAEGNPGNLLTHIYIDTEIGRDVDVNADKTAKLVRASLGIDLRPMERLELETFTQSFRLYDLDTKAWRLSEQNISATMIGHISARDTLRFITQFTLSKRNPAAYNFNVSPRTQTQALSLVYAHKRGLGREFDLGVTRSNVNAMGEPKATTTEAFAKLSWTLSL